MSKPVRISKILSDQGLASRREADEMISKGWVLLADGQKAILGQRIEPGAEWSLAKPAEEWLASKMTIAMNKPVGYVSSPAGPEYPAAVKLITRDNYADGKYPDGWLSVKGIAPLGRLDIDSRGLIIFSQNGALAKKIIGEGNEVEKEYRTKVYGNVTKEKLQLLKHGLSLDDKKLLPAKIEQEDSSTIRFTLIEGKKRQIRRMCELVDLEVSGLVRLRIGKLTLGDLEEGKWRNIKPCDVF